MSHACGCSHHDGPAALDVREMAPRIRHPKIFETFDALPAGGAFVLVNDHDPRPLFYQFQAERSGAFAWRYLEEGPEVWRVEIGKPPARYTADQTVADVSKSAGALRVLQGMGINHCCGAHLPLTEAAAAAGVSVDAVLQALHEATDARA